MLMQVIHFNCSLNYYSPLVTTSQEMQFSILPQESILIDIQPPIYNQLKYQLCVLIKNTFNKIIQVEQYSSLFNILKHSNIQHFLMWVDQSVIKCLKQRWQHGCNTYGYLKYAFTINNTGLGCGGIGAQCPL